MRSQWDLVDVFAQEMKNELQSNMHKGDWREWNDTTKMFQELEYHEDKLSKAIQSGNREAIKEHLADCANFLLMIGNAYGLY